MNLKSLLFLAIFYSAGSLSAQTDTNRLLLVKYDFSILRDTTVADGKRYTDIMNLDIKNTGTTFYSALKHLGLKQNREDREKNLSNISGMTVTVSATRTPFSDKESEYIKIDQGADNYKVFDNISPNPHYYQDSLITPGWQLLPDTMTILNEPCQKAMAFYRGREVVAWFAKNIPLQTGPWLYNGLPGLIMKVEDTRNQFSFECRELIPRPATEPAFIIYKDAEKNNQGTGP